jgi:hypothetical protein
VIYEVYAIKEDKHGNVVITLSDSNQGYFGNQETSGIFYFFLDQNVAILPKDFFSKT